MCFLLRACVSVIHSLNATCLKPYSTFLSVVEIVASTEKRFCIQCGAPLFEGAVRCGECGAEQKSFEAGGCEGSSGVLRMSRTPTSKRNYKMLRVPGG